MQHFISIADASREELEHTLAVAFELRAGREKGVYEPVLANKALAMIFEKPSLRTKVSFQEAMYELGGNAIYLFQGEVGIGKREAVEDVARVLAGMVHGICARVFEHGKLVAMAKHSDVPVINALSDFSHPCQALADVMTVMDEFGRDLTGRTLTFVGDGNNVARSLAAICGKLGISFILASPPGYELPQEDVDEIMAQNPTMDFETTHDAAEAVHHADVVYTDTWVSMGQEEEKAGRVKVFRDYQVSEALMTQAPSHAIVLHCLPAYRGYEITDEVMEGPRSRVFPQAHNRLHAQKGLLAVLMGGR